MSNTERRRRERKGRLERNVETGNGKKEEGNTKGKGKIERQRGRKERLAELRLDEKIDRSKEIAGDR